MSSKQELALDYAKRLRLALDEKAEARAIAHEIESLVYVSTGEPISAQDKNKILDLMVEEFPRPNANTGVVAIIKEADNRRYLLLVQSLRAMLTG